MNEKADEKQNITIPKEDLTNLVLVDGRVHIKTVVDLVSEPFLILNKDLRVLEANHSFYKRFKVKESDTKGMLLYELGNGQWNIPRLRKMLSDILPQNTSFRGFKVTHDFPFVGCRVMILSAREVFLDSDLFPPIILLVIEDITDMMNIADRLARHTNELKQEISGRNELLKSKVHHDQEWVLRFET